MDHILLVLVRQLALESIHNEAERRRVAHREHVGGRGRGKRRFKLIVRRSDAPCPVDAPATWAVSNDAGWDQRGGSHFKRTARSARRRADSSSLISAYAKGDCGDRAGLIKGIARGDAHGM